MEIINHKGKYYLKTESGYKEVLATTNSSLLIDINSSTAGYDVPTGIPLPQIPQQFIEKFIEEYNKGNVIKEVQVEHLLFLEPGNTLSDRKYDKTILKVNPDGTINIKPIKESWGKEEVIKLCRSAHLHGEQGALNLHNQVFKQWIEENL